VEGNNHTLLDGDGPPAELFSHSSSAAELISHPGNITRRGVAANAPLLASASFLPSFRLPSIEPGE
jgi:hypothetical protein